MKIYIKLIFVFFIIANNVFSESRDLPIEASVIAHDIGLDNYKNIWVLAWNKQVEKNTSDNHSYVDRALVLVNHINETFELISTYRHPRDKGKIFWNIDAFYGVGGGEFGDARQEYNKSISKQDIERFVNKWWRFIPGDRNFVFIEYEIDKRLWNKLFGYIPEYNYKS